MPFHYPDPTAPEITALYGSKGAGKTTAWLEMAKLSYQTGSGAKFYVLDTDGAVPAMTSEGSRFEMLSPARHPTSTNLVVRQPFGWRDYAAYANEFNAAARQGDFIVIDRAELAYDEAKSHYMTTVFGDVDEYIMQAALEVREARQAKDAAVAAGGKRSDVKGSAKGFGGLEPDDWTWIKKLYGNWRNLMVYNTPAHKIFVMGSKTASERFDGAAVVAEYSRTGGAKPAGQDHLTYDPRAVLFCEENSKGYGIYRVKDRERHNQWAEHAQNGFLQLSPAGFAMDYCVKIAGWRLA